MNKKHIDFTAKHKCPEIKRQGHILGIRPVRDERMLYVDDICAILGIGRSLAYRIIARLHEERQDSRIDRSPGCISRKYFTERLYGVAPGKGENSDGRNEQQQVFAVYDGQHPEGQDQKHLQRQIPHEDEGRQR